MTVTWTVKDSKGDLLPRFIADSPRGVGRKIVRNRYDAFRLEVSPSYREVFDRDLKTVLAREHWRIVPIKRHGRACRRNEEQLELKLNLRASEYVPHSCSSASTFALWRCDLPGAQSSWRFAEHEANSAPVDFARSQ